jgi:hypothetical protein
MWVAGLGCGGGNGDGSFDVGGPTSCGLVQPCGGSPVGTWTVTTGCITGIGIKDATSGATCTGESLSVTNINESGILVFNADMTYSFVGLSEQASYHVNVPQSCVGGTCSDAALALQGTGEFSSASCTGSSLCSCNAVQTPITDTENGTYTLAGNTIMTTSTTGGTSLLDYCVQGSYIHLIVTSTMSMGAMGQAAIDEDTIGLKQ